MPAGKSMSTESVGDILDRMASPVSLPKDTVVFCQGDAPVGVYVVRKGAVRMTVKAGEPDLLLSIAQPGAIIGLPAVLGNQPYSLTATTMDVTELGFVRAPQLVEAIRSDTTLGLQILRLLSEDVREARHAIGNRGQVQ